MPKKQVVAKPQVAASGRRKVRVLVACSVGQPNDVIELSEAEIDALDGEIDPNPAAVEYAESLKK